METLLRYKASKG